MRRKSAPGLILSLGACLLASLPAWGEDSEQLKAPLLTDPDARTFLFSIPAPRGLIVDRNGEVLARNRIIKRAAVLLEEVEIEDRDELAHYILDTATLVDAEQDVLLGNLDYDAIHDHLEQRPLLPLTISNPLTDEQVTALQESELGHALQIQTEYSREYPLGKTASHVIGFVTRNEPRPFGPILPQEPLWPRVAGREGVEFTLNNTLSGQDGILSVLFDQDGEVRKEQIIRKPRPGETLVLTLNIKMQQLAEEILAKHGRPGAVVAMDSATGDILALASYPSFDLSQFVDGISAQDFAAIQKEPGDPFFPRAFAGQYPPGSTYKPIVSLAGLHLGPIRGAVTLYACGPSLDISGRTFHNWNSTETGYYDVRQALMRSTNTWFYQAGINTGSGPILETSRQFGLGSAPRVPLENVATGNVPEKVVGNRAIANLSIGQGSLLVSPLQMAIAMSGISNGSYLAAPRLVLQTQSPPPNEHVTVVNPAVRASSLPYNSSDMRLVHQGMWGVVNAARGTGGRAGMDWPQVYGKTGTAQWTKDGEERTLSWFTGFVNAFNPRIAFAVVCEGGKGESLSGGKVAAPMAGEFLKTVYKSSSTYTVEVPDRPRSLPVVYYEPPEIPVAMPAVRGHQPPVNTGRRPSSLPFGWGVRR